MIDIKELQNLNAQFQIEVNELHNSKAQSPMEVTPSLIITVFICDLIGFYFGLFNDEKSFILPSPFIFKTFLLTV